MAKRRTRSIEFKGTAHPTDQSRLRPTASTTGRFSRTSPRQRQQRRFSWNSLSRMQPQRLARLDR
jgi:hypothetical protein